MRKLLELEFYCTQNHQHHSLASIWYNSFTYRGRIVLHKSAVFVTGLPSTLRCHSVSHCITNEGGVPLPMQVTVLKSITTNLFYCQIVPNSCKDESLHEVWSGWSWVWHPSQDKVKSNGRRWGRPCSPTSHWIAFGWLLASTVHTSGTTKNAKHLLSVFHHCRQWGLRALLVIEDYKFAGPALSIKEQSSSKSFQDNKCSRWLR